VEELATPLAGWRIRRPLRWVEIAATAPLEWRIRRPLAEGRRLRPLAGWRTVTARWVEDTVTARWRSGAVTARWVEGLTRSLGGGIGGDPFAGLEIHGDSLGGGYGDRSLGGGYGDHSLVEEIRRQPLTGGIR
jgi:hypothetical protein